MSAETTSNGGPGPGAARPDGAPEALRVLALTAVGIGLAALAAGTFVLSYSGIHVLALHAGIKPRLARGYPLMIDAMLVIALAAVLALRGADLPSKLFAWVTLLAVLAAAAGADALHAAGRQLPGHAAAITAAVLPWVLVFLAFALLLAMLRHARLRRLAATRALAAHGPSYPIVQPVLTVAHRPEPSAAVIAVAAAGSPEAGQPALAVAAEPGPDDPASDEAAPDPAGPTDQDHADQAGKDQANQADQAGEPAEHAADTAEPDEQDDPDMPVFHRMWSSPTPPEPLA